MVQAAILSVTNGAMFLGSPQSIRETQSTSRHAAVAAVVTVAAAPHPAHHLHLMQALLRVVVRLTITGCLESRRNIMTNFVPSQTAIEGYQLG